MTERSSAVRVRSLTRGPLARMAKSKSGGPTVRGIVDAMRDILRRGSKRERAGGGEGEGRDILADVSFEIEKGTVVALPGPDLGAVEVLMRIISGAIQPTAGTVEINGRMAGLLGVGENLEANASGRDAALREASLLGVEKEREGEFLGEAFEFAGLKDFDEVLVGRYSTGMNLRLGLSIVFAAKPDIVLIGDIMGVGDLEFRERCKARIRQLAAEGVTFLLAGPALAEEDLADRVLLVERGQVGEPPRPAQRASEGDGEAKATHNWHVTTDRTDGAVIRLLGIRVMRRTGRTAGTKVRLLWVARQAPCRVWPVVDFVRDNVVAFRSVAPNEIEIAEPGYFETSVAVPDSLLAPVPYRVRVFCDSVHLGRTRHLRIMQAINVVPVRPPKSDIESLPYLNFGSSWEVVPIEEAAE